MALCPEQLGVDVWACYIQAERYQVTAILALSVMKILLTRNDSRSRAGRRYLCLAHWCQTRSNSVYGVLTYRICHC